MTSATPALRARFLAVPLALLALTLAVLAIAEAETGRIYELAEAGGAYEVIADQEGHAWVSDYEAGEIRGINLATGVYTSVNVLPHQPASAQIGPDGALWWRDASPSGQNSLARWVPGSVTATVWTLPVGNGGYGLAFDEAGNAWASDSSAAVVQWLEPQANRLCRYTLLHGGISDYILFHQGHLWLGDPSGTGEVIVRLDPATGATTTWDLAVGATPLGLAADANGEIWWADPTLNVIGRLQPADDTITYYEVPTSTLPSLGPARLPERRPTARQPKAVASPSFFSAPQMVAVLDGLVWFTDETGNRFGSLNPATALGQSDTPRGRNWPAVSPTCLENQTGAPTSVTVGSGLQAWLARDFRLSIDSDGWTIYNGSLGGWLYGLAVVEGQLILTDVGNNEMIGFRDLSQRFYLPLVVR